MTNKSAGDDSKLSSPVVVSQVDNFSCVLSLHSILFASLVLRAFRALAYWSLFWEITVIKSPKIQRQGLHYLCQMLLVTLVAPLVGCQLTADSRNLQGVRLFEQSQYQAALAQFQQALAADAKNADAHYNLAATYHRVGSQQNDAKLFGQAEEYYNRCLDLNGDHVECHRGLAVLLAETDRTDRALALLKSWAVRSPQSADARIELARLYDEFGQDGNAKIELHEALKKDVNNYRAWTALAHLHEKNGDTDRAIVDYQRSLAINQMQPQVAQRLGDLSRRVASQTTPAGNGAASLR